MYQEKRKYVKQFMQNYDNEVNRQIETKKTFLAKLTHDAIQGDQYPYYLQKLTQYEEARQKRFLDFLRKYNTKEFRFDFKKMPATKIQDPERQDALGKVMDYYFGRYNGPNGYLTKHKREIQKLALKGFSETVRSDVPLLVKIKENDGY
ncbi:hypothetical protein EIN_247860 [Entamoeba invadens IP1]|uniref:Uncharacterized protein n=1 Tax=Entamoeba invadens IP1 TaxID=370355 RepID=A0A0A1UH77_ENTIV|nr:hypothetical protein EIN_247860 [Entamoeba invadens IP1]ELP94842.1 hypothetical protein EIN_247860 [Entamoeba invadens IP1]|eukprot:XP_004261613.1 hypothetical protein EIN_247860 [Entamoeba invadens IP1]